MSSRNLFYKNDSANIPLRSRVADAKPDVPAPVTCYVPIFKTTVTQHLPDMYTDEAFTEHYAMLLRHLWEQGFPMEQIHGLVRLHKAVEWRAFTPPMNDESGKQEVGTYHFHHERAFGSVPPDAKVVKEAFFEAMKHALISQQDLQLIFGVIAWYPSILQNVDKDGRSMLHLACMYCAESQVLKYFLTTCSQFAKVKDKKGRVPLHYCFWSQNEKDYSSLRQLVAYYPAALGEYAAAPEEEEIRDWCNHPTIQNANGLDEVVEETGREWNILFMIMNAWPSLLLMQTNPQNQALPFNVSRRTYTDLAMKTMLQEMKLEVLLAFAELASAGFYGTDKERKVKNICKDAAGCGGQNCPLKNILDTGFQVRSVTADVGKDKRHETAHKLQRIDFAKNMFNILVEGYSVDEKTMPAAEVQEEINCMCRANRAGLATEGCSYTGLIAPQSIQDILQHADSSRSRVVFYIVERSWTTFARTFLSQHQQDSRAQLAESAARKRPAENTEESESDNMVESGDSNEADNRKPAAKNI